MNGLHVFKFEHGALATLNTVPPRMMPFAFSRHGDRSDLMLYQWQVTVGDSTYVHISRMGQSKVRHAWLDRTEADGIISNYTP